MASYNHRWLDDRQLLQALEQKRINLLMPYRQYGPDGDRDDFLRPPLHGVEDQLNQIRRLLNDVDILTGPHRSALIKAEHRLQTLLARWRATADRHTESAHSLATPSDNVRYPQAPASKGISLTSLLLGIPIGFSLDDD